MVSVPISNSTKVLELPSLAVELIFLTPLMPRTADFDPLGDLVFDFGRRSAGLRDHDLHGRKIDIRVVHDVHAHEAEDTGEQQDR